MTIFTELSIILCITAFLSYLLRLLRQPLVVGYIMSGILIGPYMLDIFHASEEIEIFSKIGIAILLFIVGMSLSPGAVKETGKISIILGTFQVLCTTALGFLIMKGLGYETQPSLIAAIALTFSSTIIILKLLSDKGDLHKLYGKMSIGILLVQDLAATLVLIAITALGASAASQGLGLLFINLCIKGFGVIAVLYVIGRFVLPRILASVATSQELLFVFAIAWGLGMASLFESIGFSIEIGALVAGITLSVSNFAYEISSRLRPLRDFFIVIFFIVLGAEMQLDGLSALILPAIILSLFVFIIKPLIVLVSMNIIGYRTRTSFMTGVSVAQISEFSLILTALCVSVGYITPSLASLITLVGIITIAGSTYLISYADTLYMYIKSPLKLLSFGSVRKKETDDTSSVDMIIFGYDRVGYDFVQVAHKIHSEYLVVDFNPQAIKIMHAQNIPCRYGDAEDVEFLEEIALSKAKLVVSTIPDFKVNKLLAVQYRKHNADGVIILLSYDARQAKELYALGATYVIIPHYLGAHHASRMISKYATDPEFFDKERELHLAHIDERERLLKRA